MSIERRALENIEVYVTERYPLPWRVFANDRQVRIDAADGTPIVAWSVLIEQSRNHWTTVAKLIVDRVNQPAPLADYLAQDSSS